MKALRTHPAAIAVIALAAVIVCITAFLHHRRGGTAAGKAASPPIQPVMAADAFWKITPVISSAEPDGSVAAMTLEIGARIAEGALRELKPGDVIELTLPTGRLSRAVVNFARDDRGILRVAGALAGESRGSFSLAVDSGGRLMGLIMLPDEDIAGEISPGADAGSADMTLHRLSELICDPPLPEDGPEHAELPPRMEAAPLHNSRPSAVAVLYLCFDGATVTDPDWNYGNTIHAAASPLSVAQITEVWRRVSEDFSPFDINVTTDPSAYDNAPVGKRMRCIITPTYGWYGGAGGTAYMRSFRNGGRSRSSTIPCWVFNQGVTGASETISHELGHTLGLSHDGRVDPPAEYYSGHNDWGPIMGSSYSRKIVHWSKGEYAGADNPEDDMLVIASSANGFGYINEGAGSTPETAAFADTTRDNIVYDVITGADDVNYHKITLVAPVTLFADASPSNYSPNLDISLVLLDHEGHRLASHDPASEMGARIEQPLAAGDYYIKIDGVGRGNPLADGYSDYGSVGVYALSLGYGPPVQPPEITRQPENANITVAETEFYLHATVEGRGTLRLRWQKDGADLPPSERIPIVTTDTLHVRNPQLSDSGLYTLVALNEGGSTTSAAARVDVVPLAPPVITGFTPDGAAPGSKVVITGLYFGGVIGVYFDGIPTAEFTVDSATQITARAPGSLAGPGRITVVTVGGTAVSTGAFFFATAPSQLKRLAATQPVTVGNSTLFSAKATANPDPWYYWQVSKDGGTTWSALVDDDNHSGSGNLRLGLLDVTAAMHNYRYRYVADNGYGSAASNAVTLKVMPVLFSLPVGLDIDDAGNLYVTDRGLHTVLKITPLMKVETFAGKSGQKGSDDGAGSEARFSEPRTIAFDYRTRTLLVADTGNATIRRVALDGTVTTIAGIPGRFQHKDDNLHATFASPSGIALDAQGNASIADDKSHTIRLRTPDGGISTIIGAPGEPGAVEATGTDARLRDPSRVVIDNRGNLFIADTGNSVIRTVAADGTVLIFAGKAGVSGTLDHNAPLANLNRPRGMDIDSEDNLYFADRGNSTIRMISNEGEVVTIAGIPGVAGLADGEKNEALFDYPTDVSFDGDGNLYVADTGNAVIRKIELATGSVTTLLLSGSSFAPIVPPSPIRPDAGNGGGGGGGGAPSPWYLGAIAALAIAGALRQRRQKRE